jgi:putative component of toxin-antitoxin plasmid stabilization module
MQIAEICCKKQLLSRLARVENGHFGDGTALSADWFELRCFFGGGRRVSHHPSAASGSAIGVQNRGQTTI